MTQRPSTKAVESIAQELALFDTLKNGRGIERPTWPQMSDAESAIYMADARAALRRFDPCAMAVAIQKAAKALAMVLGKSWDSLTPDEHAQLREKAVFVTEAFHAHLAGEDDDAEPCEPSRSFTVHEGGLNRSRLLGSYQPSAASLDWMDRQADGGHLD